MECVIYYGGIYIATSNASLSVVPLPRDASIHPRVVTSERDVTRVITCSAEFPGVSAGVMGRVQWFVSDGRAVQRVSDSEMTTLRADVDDTSGTTQRQH